jgi:predicted  nucleic acid-binding Zn-ribbon protein
LQKNFDLFKEQLRFLQNQSASKEELEKTINDFSSLKDKVSELVSSLQGVLRDVNAIKINLIKKEEFDVLQEDFLSLKNKSLSLESNLQKLVVEINNTKNSLQALLSKIEETKNFVTKNDIETLVKKYVNIEDFSSLLLDFKKLQQEFEKSKHELLSLANKSEIQQLTKEIETLKEEIKNVKKDLIPHEIIQQIANKLSLVEAKITQMEKRLETKVKPIILE